MYNRLIASSLLLHVFEAVQGFLVPDAPMQPIALPKPTFEAPFEGDCLDLEGNHVDFGEKYFDGTVWTVCAQEIEANEQELMEFMKEKWLFFFWEFDFDHDNTITKMDFEVFENDFIRSYRLCDSSKVDKVWHLFDRYSNCLVFDELKSNQSLSKDTFLEVYEQAFTANKEEAKQHMQRCAAYISEVIDQDGDCFLSSRELLKNNEAWGLSDRELIETIFNLIGPNDDNLVPRIRYQKYYGELAMGTDKEAFEDIKKAYVDAGYEAPFFTCDTAQSK